MFQFRSLRFVVLGLVAGLELLAPAKMVAQDSTAKPPVPFLRELTGERRPKVPSLDSLPIFESEYGWMLLSREMLYPFKTLLTMSNPVNGNTMGWPTRTAMGVFYMQAVSLLHFLMEQSKDPALFPAILTHDARGAPFAEWLQANGKRYNLPTTIDGLEAAWKAWVGQQAARKP